MMVLDIGITRRPDTPSIRSVGATSFINLASHLHCMNECTSHSIFPLQGLCSWPLLQDIWHGNGLSIHSIKTYIYTLQIHTCLFCFCFCFLTRHTCLLVILKSCLYFMVHLILYSSVGQAACLFHFS